ncbi:MAG TPA: tRNA pseudouridine(38-40) synthase TruA [Bryobacteraceae bacterium]|nr:tRNA pseudouridine(38-40) synthase TruA [Bryobacteraceae bacterium]
MRRIKLTIAYDGTEYKGWQVQPGLPTVQGFLEAAFLDIEKAPVHVAGSGRTDAGVHALAQVAAVSIRNPIPTRNLKKALNRLLPFDIRVNAVEEAHEQFHPRFDAVSKTYEYRLHRGEVCSPFARRYLHHHPYPMDDSMFIEAASQLVGEFDFSCFSASDDRDAEKRSKVRRIFDSEAILTGERLIYRVTGSGFLKHMVRNIVGTLLEAGKGNVDREQLRWLLTAPPNIKAGPTAPASGLFLTEVHYGSNDPATIGTRSKPTVDA